MLRQLEIALNQLPQNRHPFVFPILDLNDVVDETTLQAWLLRAAGAVPAFAPTGVAHVELLGLDAERLCNECDATCQVLLVEGFEEASDDWRARIEEFLARVVQAANVRVVLPRRDEYALVNTYLFSKQREIRLDPLPNPLPSEQIERRLALAGHVAMHWSAWDQAVNNRIVAAHLTAPQQAALLKALSSDLTPNPYINLLLLWRMLGQPDWQLGAGDYRWCLEQYMERAGVPNLVEFVIGLKRQPGYWPDGRFSESLYTGRMSEPTMDSLLKAGVVENLGQPGYQLEAGVVVLIRYLP